MWLDGKASATLLALVLAVCGSVITVTLELRRPGPFPPLLIGVSWFWCSRASAGAETACELCSALTTLATLALTTLASEGLLSFLTASVPKIFFSPWLYNVALPLFTFNSVGLKGSLLLLFFKILICAVLFPKNPGSVKYLLFKELKIGLNEEEYNLIIAQNNLVLRLVLRDLGLVRIDLIWLDTPSLALLRCIGKSTATANGFVLSFALSGPPCP